MELSNVADLLQGSIGSTSGIVTFTIISCTYLAAQYFLLRYSKAITSELRSRKNDVRFMNSVVFLVQIFIIGIFALLVAEIVFGGAYDVFILILVTIVSNGLALVTMLYLFIRLFGYYRSHPQQTILIYAISGFIISTTALITIFFMVPILLTKPPLISALTGGSFPNFIPGSTLDILNYAYYVLSIISFLSVWVATVAILKHYVEKVGNAKFWLAMSLPLIFYIGQIIVISLQIPFPYLNLDQASFIFYYRVVFTVSSTFGGILFSQPFFLASKLVPNNSNIHRHLIILGIGMVLFFVSGSATVYHVPYPPFGLATVALIGTSSYLLFLGLYSCAISLSEDSQLYKLIRTSANEWKFFLKLSDAEAEKTILDKVTGIKQGMTTETGITPSISINDAKNYLRDVLDELNKHDRTAL